MTHKLISIDQAAEWLHVPVHAVEGFIHKGWLNPAVPVEPSYFDATQVNQLKKRLARQHRETRWQWSLAGTLIGIALATWFIGKACGQEDELS